MHPLFLFKDLSEKSFLYGYSALDDFFGLQTEGFYRVVTEAGLVDLGMLTEQIVFPGEEKVDAIINNLSEEIIIECIDSEFPDLDRVGSFKLPFFKDIKNGSYKDPRGIYPILKKLRGSIKKGIAWDREKDEVEQIFVVESYQALAEAAILLARYKFPLSIQINIENQELLSPLLQRELLTQVLTGFWAETGLSLLMRYGFIETHWPEISSLNSTFHNKEYHPEGNVWEHTLATLPHRKTRELTISLALFLHDLGKPFSIENGGRTFDRHAQIGALRARKFLSNLGFSPTLISSVCFLIQEHMLPAAVAKLPASRVEKVLSSPLFPYLLELYRCDLSSTFQGPQGFYEACQAYRAFLRNKKNPFRNSGGKKLLRLYVD